MSEITKEELIENLKQFLINCPSGSWDKGYNVAIKNSIKLAKQLPDTPKRYMVKIGEQHYFVEFNGAVDKDDSFCYEQDVDVYYAHLFTDKRKAELVAELIGGEVEEVSNE